MTLSQHVRHVNLHLLMVFQVLVAILGILGTYQFYFGDCAMVKQFWYVIQVPGRCL